MTILTDRNVSVKAKGLYYMIKTLQDNGESFTKQSLYNMSSNGYRTVDSAWKELKDNGYLKIEKENVNGTFIYKYLLLK